MKTTAKIIWILSLSTSLLFVENTKAQSSITFNYTGSIQTWTVPPCVTAITVQAYGAAGGTGSLLGGKGAEIVGTFTTMATGDVLDIMVGQEGLSNNEGSGGGGTFIWDATMSNTLFVAAGGGGGSYQSGQGGAGSATNTPTAGTGNQGSSPGGVGGNGGTGGACTSSYAGGGAGAGWSSNGGIGSSCGGYGGGNGGNTPLSGGAGGASNVVNGCTYSSVGGYGGGGASTCYAAGGGGGYNGGGGAYGFVSGGNGAGGGGSFNGGSNQTNTAGVEASNGSVTIYYSGISITANIVNNVTCDGGSNGSASAIVNTGTPPYTYVWAPGGQTTDTITGLAAGSYTVTVSEGCGASATAMATITQPNPLGVSAFTTKSVVCNGGSTGRAGSTVMGGSGPFTYSWAPSGGSNSTATGLTAGTYTLSVSDVCGSTASSSTTINQPGPLSAGGFITAYETCNGGNTGSATAFGSSGTPAYTYAWAPSGGTNANATGLAAGSYTVTITDSCGATATIRIIITQPAPIVVTLNATANEICRGAFQGSASSSINGGTGPYNYSWTGGAGHTDTAVGLTAGSYTLSVTDVNGCTGSSSVTITEPTILITSASVTANVNCNGGTTGSALAGSNGGTRPYTYSWFPSGGNTRTATGLSAGTYTVTVNDNCDAVATASVTITQTNAILVSTETTANVLCNAGTDGSASSSTSGGTSPYTYAWTGGGTNATDIGLSAGTYALTVTDINGCTSSDETTITQPSPLSIVQNSIPDDGKCTGSAWVNVSGGVSPYTYLWSNGNTTYLDPNRCKGSYCCKVTDANGCIDSVCISVKSTLAIQGITSGSGQIKIYPNPNNGMFTIELSSAQGKALIDIYNLLGEKVYSMDNVQSSIANSPFSINLSNQPNGIYLYRIINDTGNILGEGKIIIQK